MRRRPANLPHAAVWIAEDNEWELGKRHGKLCVGEWTWWRPDGTLVATTPFDEAGRPHGVCRRYHPSGELALEAPYRRGRVHGKQVMTRALVGDSVENPVLHDLDGVYRMDTLNLDGVPQGFATFYNRDGVAAPVPVDGEGRSIDLGLHLGKLLKTTAMVLTAPFLHTMTGKLPSSMVGAVQYICLAVVNSTMHRLYVTDDRGDQAITIVHAEEISRALTLAVDYRAAQLV